MEALDFDIDINVSEYLARYRTVSDVLVMVRSGQRVRFPASNLQRYVGHDGIHGSFRIVFDQNFKLIQLNRLG